MKVLHLISSGGMYGAEAVILNLSRTMNERERSSEDCYRSSLGVFTSCGQQNLELHAAAGREGLNVYPIACEGQIDRSALAAISELADQLEVDVVHTHGFKADVYGWFAFRGRPLPLVSTCHNWIDDNLLVRMYGVLDRYVLRAFAGVVAVSNAVRERLIRAGVNSERVRLISNGVDLRPFAGPPFEPPAAERIRVGWVGRLSSEKGCDLFIRAAAQVLQELPSVEFWIAGDGPLREELQSLISGLGISENVRLLGRQNDMPAFFRSLQLLVSSSRTEGLPIALLEGMAAGLPLVATRVGEVPTLVLHGITGTLLPVGDVAALATGILNLVRNDSQRRSFGMAGRDRIALHFSAEQMTAEYISLYQQVIDDRRSRCQR